MELTRIIHSVGQGAFYTETFFNGKDYFNIVYDCGGSKKEIIKQRIDCYLSLLKKQEPKNPPTINAVFVSHFHDDHINGLDYLRKNASIQYLFIPQLTKKQIIELIVYNIINNQEKNTTDLIFNILNKKHDKDTKIIEVKVLDEMLNNNLDRHLIDISSLHDNGTILSGEEIYSKIFEKWRYIPYNPKILDDTKLNELHENLKKEFNISDNFSYQELPEILKGKENLKKCREIYGKTFGKNNHNSYSMTLFSGLNYPNSYKVSLINQKICEDCFICRRKETYIKNPNCLYTGDFEVKNNFNELKNFYNNLKLWNIIKTIQVPHHCSRKNYFSKLYSNIYSCFMSVGIKNRYRHPNIDTLINIQKKVCDVNIVTEHKNTEKIYKYCMK